MKKLLTLALIALLLLALAACGTEPVAATQAPTTTTEATSTTLPPTTPTTTEEATTTTKTTITQRPTTTTHIFQREIDAINNSDMTEREKKLALQLLEMPCDENGVYYYEPERWTATKPVFPPPYGFSPRPEMIYDFGSVPPLIQLVYATVRVKFQYAGQAWMIQMWKGRYGLVMLGGEIAVLKKPIEQAAEHYLPATEAEELAISMDVYQHNFDANETKHLFSRSTNSAWWFNGFKPGGFYLYNRKSEIIMVGTITFPNQEMLQAFEESFKKIGFKRGTPDSAHPETYAVNDNSLTFSWQYIDQDA